MSKQEVDNQNVIRGICATFILFTHLRAFTKYNFIFNAFTPFGYLWVGIFFFYSGYNLISSFMNKKNFFDKFWRKKLVRIYLPLIISNILFLLIAIFCNSARYDTLQILKYIFGVECINDINWYIYAICSFYVSAWCVLKIANKFRNKSNEKILLTISSVVIFVIYGLLYYHIGFNLHLTTRITNTIPVPMLLGMLYPLYKDRVDNFIANDLVYEVLLIITFVASGVLHYSNINQFPFFIFNIEVINFMVPIFFTIFAMLVAHRLKLKSKIFSFISTFSLELYVFHPVIMNLFNNSIFKFASSYYFLACYLIVVIALAYVTNRFVGQLLPKKVGINHEKK